PPFLPATCAPRPQGRPATLRSARRPTYASPARSDDPRERPVKDAGSVRYDTSPGRAQCALADAEAPFAVTLCPEGPPIRAAPPRAPATGCVNRFPVRSPTKPAQVAVRRRSAVCALLSDGGAAL